MGRKAPALVVHTKAPKRTEDKPGLLDGMWACLLNDYLESLGDADADEYGTDSSTSDVRSVSTEALREERRRLKLLKKKEQKKIRMNGKNMDKLRESASALAEQRLRNLEQHAMPNTESTAYRRDGLLVDVASKSVISQHIRKSEARDKYDSVHDGGYESKQGHRFPKLAEQKARSKSRATLEPEAAASPMPVHSWSGAAVRPGLSPSKSQASSVDADGMVARSKWMQIKESESNIQSTVDPDGKSLQRRHSKSKARVDAHGVIHIEEPSTATQPFPSKDNHSWHSRRGALSDTPKLAKSHHQRKSSNRASANDPESTLQSNSSPQDTSTASIIVLQEFAARGNFLAATSNQKRMANEDSISTVLTFPKAISVPKDASPRFQGPSMSRVDSRDTEDNVWSLEEDKRSELDEIRRKKLDREEALIRIRAIKARIAKLET